MKLNPQAPTSKGRQGHILGEFNYSHLTTVLNVPKQSFVLHPEGTNVKEIWEQMQVLKSQQSWNELCEL